LRWARWDLNPWPLDLSEPLFFFPKKKRCFIPKRKRVSFFGVENFLSFLKKERAPMSRAL